MTARDDWTPSEDSSSNIFEDEPRISIKTKAKENDESLDSCQQSQADWIKRYVEQQEEVLTESISKLLANYYFIFILFLVAFVDNFLYHVISIYSFVRFSTNIWKELIELASAVSN